MSSGPAKKAVVARTIALDHAACDLTAEALTKVERLVSANQPCCNHHSNDCPFRASTGYRSPFAEKRDLPLHEPLDRHYVSGRALSLLYGVAES